MLYLPSPYDTTYDWEPISCYSADKVVIVWDESIKLASISFSYHWTHNWKTSLYLQTVKSSIHILLVHTLKTCILLKWRISPLVSLSLHTETTGYHISEALHETSFVTVFIFPVTACSCVHLSICQICWRRSTFATFGVFTVVSLRILCLWYVTLLCGVNASWCSDGTVCFHLQWLRGPWRRSLTASNIFLNHWEPFTHWYSVTSQKTRILEYSAYRHSI
jgi:hypothetical protein